MAWVYIRRLFPCSSPWPQNSYISQWITHDITGEKEKWKPPDSLLFFLYVQEQLAF